MRPRVLPVLRAAAPLLARRQPPRLRAAALALCRRLAALDPDTAWLFFVGFLPIAERWSARPPATCARPDSSTLLTPPSGAAYPPAAAAAADGGIAPSTARRVLEAVSAADARVATRAVRCDKGRPTSRALGGGRAA